MRIFLAFSAYQELDAQKKMIGILLKGPAQLELVYWNAEEKN